MMIIDPYRGGVTGPATIEYVGLFSTTFSGAGNEIRTASGVDFGAIASGRLIVAVLNYARAAPAANIVSVTIGGIAATVHVVSPPIDPQSALYNCAIVSAFVPTGSSGDIVATFDQAAGTTIAVYRATNVAGLVDTAAAADDDTVTVNIDETADGIVVAAGVSAFTINPYSWTHITERYEEQLRWTGGEAITPATVSGQAISMSSDHSAVGSPALALIAASFR